MREAVIDALFLLNRGHSLKRATHFVMEHYQLADMQRIALTRGLCTDDEIVRRRATMLERGDVARQTVYLDGFNAIILMESVVSESPIFRCVDCAIRDLANLKGSYHIIDKTEPAIRLILNELDALGVEKAIIHIDSPVSNSRNLKMLICSIAQDYRVEVEVELIDACDISFYGREYVISGDGIVMETGQLYKGDVPLIRLLAVVDYGHWNFMPTARVMWDFFMHYRRDPETKRLIYIP